MFVQVLAEVRRIVRELDPARLSGTDATSLMAGFGELKRLAASAEALLAARAVETNQWRHEGDRSPEHWLARKTGAYVGAARELLDTAERLKDLPATEQALRQGVLSVQQASVVAKGASVDPAAEQQLLKSASGSSLRELERHADRVIAAKRSADEERQREDAIRKARSLRVIDLPDGSAELRARGNKVDVAMLRARLQPWIDEQFQRARKEDRQEPVEAYGFDGLVAMAAAAETGSGTAKSPAKVLVRVDLSALRRGTTEPGEVCEIAGYGSIPVSEALKLMPEALVAIVCTDGKPVNVTHLGPRKTTTPTTPNTEPPTAATPAASAISTTGSRPSAGTSKPAPANDDSSHPNAPPPPRRFTTMWDFETEPEFQEKLDWMREFIDGQLVPLEPIVQDLPRAEWKAVKAHLQDQVKGQGLWGAFLDPALGGPGFGQLKLALMSELIGRCMYSMTIFGVQAPDSGNMELLAHGANDEQKKRWLEPNMRGEISSAFALTEPFFAGADPTHIGTTAILDGDEWVINGHKWFSTNASVADIILVYAETDPDQRPHRHVSMFVVEKGTPGMDIVRDIPTMAHPDVTFGRPGNHAEIVFRDCRVSPEHLIGSRGEGFVLAQKRLGGGRIHHAMRWIGQAKRSLDIMCERAVSRESHGKLLAQHQMVQDYVATSHTEIEAARLLTFQTAWKMDKYGASAVRADISMVKAHVSRVVLNVLDRTIQVCGALGYSGDLPVEGWYRTTRFGTIGDGPDEVHKTVVARTLLKQYSPVTGWPSEHIPSRRPAAEAKWEELKVAAGVA